MLLAIAVICTLFESVFTALEVALGAVSRARIKALLETNNSSTADNSSQESTESSPKIKARARRLLDLMERPERLTLVFITVTSLTMWTTATILTWHAMQENWAWWLLALALVGVLFLAEVIPLLIAARHTEAIALSGSGFVKMGLLLMTPLVAIVSAIGRGAAGLLGAGTETTPSVTEGELRSVLASAEEEGVIESDERALLESAMDFRDKVVREVMTPRVDIIGVEAQTPLGEVLRLALDKGHSRLPVYEDSPDHIIGIIAAKDLLPAVRTGENQTLPASDMMRAPFFVPEDKGIASTLEELRRQRSLLAIVVESDGGTAGLVTLEDLLEEIVGEIQDEYDVEEPSLSVTEYSGQPAVQADASVTVRDFGRFWQRHHNTKTELQDPDGEAFDASLSLAALALKLFDGVPNEGDETRAGLSINDSDKKDTKPLLHLRVLGMNGPRIEEVLIWEEAEAKEDESD